MEHAFADLPGSLQETVLAACRDDPRPGVFVTRLGRALEGYGPAILCASFGLGVLGYLLFSTDEGLLIAPPLAAGIAGLTALFFAVAAARATHVRAVRKTGLTPCLIVTPTHVIVIRSAAAKILLLSLRKLEEASAQGASVELVFAEETLTVEVAGAIPARNVLTFVERGSERLGELTEEEKDLERIEPDTRLPPREPGPAVALVALAAVAGVLAAFGAWGAGVRLLDHLRFTHASHFEPELPEYRKWNEAARVQLGSFAWFAPFFEHATRALEREDDYVFMDILSLSRSFEGYLNGFPGGRHATEADDLLFRAALASPDVDLLARYATYPPVSRHTVEADEALFKRAKTAAQLATYLSALPQGRHAAQVMTALDDVTFEEARTARDLRAFVAYEKDFPSGRHQARPAIAALYEETAVRIEDGRKNAARAALADRVRGLAGKPEASLRVSAVERDPDPDLAATWRLLSRSVPRLASPLEELSPVERRKRGDDFGTALEKAFVAAFPAGMFHVSEGPTADLTIVARFRLVPTGTMYEFDDMQSLLLPTVRTPQLPWRERDHYLAIRVDADLELGIPGGFATALGVSGEPKDSMFFFRSRDVPLAGVYQQMVSGAFEHVKDAALAAYGLSGRPPG